MSKTIVVSHSGRNKKVVIPPQDAGNTFHYLRNKCISLFDFKFNSNVNLDIIFQKYDEELQEYIDIEKEEEQNNAIQHKDKLKMVVTPTIVQESGSVAEVRCIILC